MEPLTSKVKDIPESIENDITVEENRGDNATKNSILENLVTSVKRKLNQSLSPNSQKQEEKGDADKGSKVTALKRSRKGPDNKNTDIDCSLIIEEFDSEDDCPLATITKKRTRALVKAKRFKKALQRKGTPIKNAKLSQHQVLKDNNVQHSQQERQPQRKENEEKSTVEQTLNAHTMEIFEKMQKNITEVRLDTAANKIEIQRLHKNTEEGVKEIAEIDREHITNAQAIEMFEKLQKDITDMKLDTAVNKVEIQRMNENAELMVSKVSKVLTQEQMEETIKKYTGPIQKTLETQSVEIKRHTTEIGKIEESLGTIQISLTAHETELEGRKRKDYELEHDIGIVRAEAISRVDELQRQVKDVQEQLTIKKVVEKQGATQMTYAQVAATPLESEVQERAIIIEGVHEHRDEQLDEILFRLADEMRLPVHDWEINRIERIGSWRPDRRWPRPIKVEFTTIRKRDMFIANRQAVEQTDHFYRIRIREDEPLQSRQLKSKLRRAVNTARKEGRRAKFLNDEEILIEGRKYDKGNIDQHLDKPGGDDYKGMPLGNKNNDVTFGGHCIKTPKGLAFFGYRSILSSFYQCTIMREGKRHETLEHGYQGDKALDAKDDARYNRIRNAKTAAAAKKIGGEVENTERWNRRKRLVMRGWLFEKYRQHPQLADFLISTKGYQLIEASPYDDWWGAGAGLESKELNEGSWDGKNVLGEELEYVREILIEERKPWNERFQGLGLRIPPPLRGDQLAATQPEQVPHTAPAADTHTPGIHQPMDITTESHSTRL